ncbi:MAG: hypothetical protein JNL58_26370 [Planctomyces sp.]|nr:hypothetical protein [Planctomyces sp.]
MKRMIPFLVLAFVSTALSLCVPATAGEETPFEVGVGMRIITPDPLLPVSGGLGAPEPVTEKRGDITVRAMVFRKGETVVAFVGLDLLGFPSVLAERVRKQVPEIPGDHILMGASHTHSAPDCYGFPLPSGGFTGDLNYMQFVCEKAAEAVREAFSKLEPASLRVNTDRAADRIAYNYYAPALYDPSMSVIQAVRSDGSVIGTLVNYAIHPEVLGNEAGILSPDAIGPMYDRIEQKAGGMAMFMNGAQGGMVTADNRDLSSKPDPVRAVWSDLRTWDECLRIGHLMADEALRIIEKAPQQADPRLVCHSRDIRFPVESPLMWAVVVGSPLKYPHNDDHSITSRVNFVELGNAQILTIPGEALPNIGFFLKRKMKGEHNLLFGLTNDAFGYILTRVDYASFDRYNYVSRTSLGEMTGEILIEQSLQMIEAAGR